MRQVNPGTYQGQGMTTAAATRVRGYARAGKEGAHRQGYPDSCGANG
jgi:hypothetical protein